MFRTTRYLIEREFSDHVNTRTPTPTPQTVILGVTEGWDEKNGKTLSEDGKLYVVQISDDDWWDTEADYSNFFEFENIIIPSGVSIQSVKIYVEHWEEEGISGGAVEWQAGTGSLSNPSVIGTQQAPVRSR